MSIYSQNERGHVLVQHAQLRPRDAHAYTYQVAVASGGDLSVKDQCQCEELYKNGLDRVHDVSFEHFSLMVAGTCV